MWHKAEWMGHPMKLELKLAGLQVKLANHYTTGGALSNLQSTFALMWHKAEWMEHPMRLKLTLAGLLVLLANHYTIRGGLTYNVTFHIYFTYALISLLISRQTADWPIYISTIFCHMSSSSIFHFNVCVCWPEIRVQITQVTMGTFFYITYIYIKYMICKHIL